MIIENIVCTIVGILIGYAGMYVADYKLTRIKELKSIPHTDNTSVIDTLQNRIRELLQKTI